MIFPKYIFFQFHPVIPLEKKYELAKDFPELWTVDAIEDQPCDYTHIQWTKHGSEKSDIDSVSHAAILFFPGGKKCLWFPWCNSSMVRTFSMVCKERISLLLLDEMPKSDWYAEVWP